MIVVKEELLCLADPFLLLYFDMIPHLFGGYKSVDVVHEDRVSKFGLERFVNGLLDLISLWFLSKFGKKPMHFFGLTGILMFLAGAALTIWVIAEKLIQQAQGLVYRPVTDQPLFYLALVAVLLGFQLFLAGFICEMVSRNSSERNTYKVREEI